MEKVCFSLGSGKVVADVEKVCFSLGSGKVVADVEKGCLSLGSGKVVADVDKGCLSLGSGKVVAAGASTGGRKPRGNTLVVQGVTICSAKDTRARPVLNGT